MRSSLSAEAGAVSNAINAATNRYFMMPRSRVMNLMTSKHRLL